MLHVRASLCTLRAFLFHPTQRLVHHSQEADWEPPTSGAVHAQGPAGAPNRLAPLGAAQAHTARLRYSTGKELYFIEHHSDLDSSPGP